MLVEKNLPVMRKWQNAILWTILFLAITAVFNIILEVRFTRFLPNTSHLRIGYPNALDKIAVSRFNQLIVGSSSEKYPVNRSALMELNKEKYPYVPPLVFRPAGEWNNYRNFTTQCLLYNLNVYQASPGFQEEIPEDRVLHFIFIARNTSDTMGESITFNLINYLVVRAAYMRLQPRKIYIHMNKPAKVECPYWEMIRPMVDRVIDIPTITEIFGNKVSGPAHMSDIARLHVLQEYGGLYMDIDSISLRPFTKLLWNPPSGVMMGYQHNKRKRVAVGVIAARKNSSFLSKWLESYRTFNDSKWDTHSVAMASSLAEQYPDEIDVVPRYCFYFPSWRKKSLALLWETKLVNDTHMYEFPDTLAPHFWGQLARNGGYIDRMTPHTILTENNGIHQVLRGLLPSPFFTISLSCDHPRLYEQLEAIVQQSFSLWEIILDTNNAEECSTKVFQQIVPHMPRLQLQQSKFIKIGNTAVANGVWQIPLVHEDRTLARDALEILLSSMKDDVVSRSFVMSNVSFNATYIYDSRRKIDRIPPPV